MTGIQDVVFRIPEEWDAVWFDSLIQDLFRYSDIRNAKGVGIGITGDSDTVATLSSTTLSEAYVVTQASSELTDERVLAGETGVIDITDGGPGNNVTVSVATNGIDFEKLQTVSTAIFAGRITAGTGDIEELTATQATSLLNAFTGDSGSGGTKGLVPAPSSGDAGKYLDGDGTFTTTNTAFNKNFGTSAGTVLEGDTAPSDIGAVPTSRTLTAGVGLSGGGNLTVDRTFDMANTAVSAGSYTTTNLTVDAQGRITAASSGTAGATTFDALTDTPSSKSGQAGKVPLVNGGETALEYVALSGIYQPLDATLTTIAATNPTTDQINYFTGSNVASVTSLTSFARTLLDDTTQGAMQTTLNVDPAGTDNSTNVTLDGTPNYITIVGQLITRALISLTSHVTGILPLTNGGTGSATITAAEIGHVEAMDQDVGTGDNVTHGVGTFTSGTIAQGTVNYGPSPELTIATGEVTITASSHKVDTEANAATDDLVTINGGANGDRLILRAASSARTVVCKDQTGNLRLAGNADFSLDHNHDTIELFYQGSNWLELSRSSNS